MNPLLDKPDGVLFDRRSELHRVVVVKSGTQIRLYFADPKEDIQLSGIMSRIDLENPLTLLGVYTQAMMLALLWKPEPQRVYMLGFAGGRIPRLLHHYFPQVIIESTDIDNLVPDIATRYFGLTFNQRQLLTIQDGREYLEKRPSDEKFDLILIDAFRGTGRIPYKFGTVDFYELCQRHAAPDAVVCMNIINKDALFKEKINTFRHCFRQVQYFVHQGAYVVFGSNRAEPLTDFHQLAQALQVKHQFQSPFVEHAAVLKTFTDPLSAVILTDAQPPIALLQQIPGDDPIFYKAKPNAPCPCGSGLKYKKCHGK